MSNVIPFNKNAASRATLYDRIRANDQAESYSAWDTAECLAYIKDDCEVEGDNFFAEVEEHVGYSKTQARDYVQIYDNLNASGGELAKKGCSFNTLKALAAENLPKADRRKLLDRLRKKDRITKADCSKVQADVRAALPRPKTIAQIAGDIDLPVFSERLAKCVRDELIGGGYLFALRDDCNVEDIKTVAKVYKQKYHPDKGGSAEEFDAICRAEQAFIESKTGGAK